MFHQIKHTYEFGPFRLDPAERLLMRNEEPVSLTAKAFDTLLVLVENGGQVVKKDTLMERVWSDTIVEESTLAQNIFTLRKVLGDGDSDNQYIETVPKFGYRFIAEVKATGGNGGKDTQPTQPKTFVSEKGGANDQPVTRTASESHVSANHDQPKSSFRKTRAVWLAASGLIIALTITLIAVWLSGRRSSSATTVKTIAVLPFKPISPDGRDEYLEYGMAETLITKLSQINQLVVRPMGAVRRYAGFEQDPLAAGRELKADFVLEGGLQKRDDRIRITARLVNVQNGQSLWADTFDENSIDVFRVQEVISRQMATALDLKLTGDEKNMLARRETENVEAYQFYHEGRYFWNKRTEQALRKGIACFEQAIARDPDYALAYSAIADSYTSLGTWGLLPPKETFVKARQAAIKALAIDSNLAEAQAALAYATLLYDWDPDGAEAQFRRAIEINPKYGPAHQWYANCLMSRGRFDEALQEVKRAQETDSVSLAFISAGGWVCFLGRQYDQAIAECRRALDLNPNYFSARKYLALVYQQKGLHDEAISEFQKAYQLSGEIVYLLAELGHAYATAGRRAEAQKTLKELSELSKRRYVPPYPIALIYAGLGDNRKAFAWLEKAYDERHPWLVQIKIDPRLDSLRSDPAFSDLERRICSLQR